jgi:hypothetical protein
MEFRGILAQLETLAEVRQGSIEVASAQPRDASILVGDEEIGPAIDRFVEIGQSACDIAHARMGVAAIEIDIRQGRGIAARIEEARAGLDIVGWVRGRLIAESVIIC